MMAVLTGRVAVVTGASTGIGAGLAAMLATEGAKVVLAARREAELDRVATGIRAEGGTALPVVTDLASDKRTTALPGMRARGFGRIINIGRRPGSLSSPA